MIRRDKRTEGIRGRYECSEVSLQCVSETSLLLSAAHEDL